MSKILITGGAGFAGGNLAIHLANQGHQILSVDNLVRRGSELNLKRFHGFKNIDFMHGDIRNKEDLDKIKFNPDVVLECSAQTTAVDGYDNPIYDVTNNTTGLINVLEFCRQRDSALIFWSTNKVYSGDICNSVPIIEKNTRFEWDISSDYNLTGWSTAGFNENLDINGGNHTIYGVTKTASDLFCQEWASAFDMPIIVNRFSCLYGPFQFGMVTQGWITWFILAKQFGLDLTFFGFSGKQVRDCLYIDDVYSLIDTQITNISQHRGSYYNVGGGKSNTVSVMELNSLLDNMMETKTLITHASPRKADQKIYVSDIEKITKDFDWAPTVSMEAGLHNIIRWAHDNENVLSGLIKRQ